MVRSELAVDVEVDRIQVTCQDVLCGHLLQRDLTNYLLLEPDLEELRNISGRGLGRQDKFALVIILPVFERVILLLLEECGNVLLLQLIVAVKNHSVVPTGRIKLSHEFESLGLIFLKCDNRALRVIFVLKPALRQLLLLLACKGLWSVSLSHILE
jgi:hypothetical protein